MKRLSALFFLVFLTPALLFSHLLAESFDAPVRTSAISRFHIGKSERRFGALAFAGGFSISSSQRHFGAVSGFSFLDNGTRFLAITDNGYWLSGQIERDGDGVPVSMKQVQLREIEGENGRPLSDKYLADAESLSVHGTIATVGFERQHRLTEFALVDSLPGRALRNLDLVVPAYELRSNRGFECLARSPDTSVLAGARIAISEKSLDKQGNIFGAVLEGPGRGIFSVLKSGPFDITDCAFLPDGDLVILERRYSVATGVGMQLRRIAMEDIAKGKLLDGNVLFTGGMEYQIDNMEALDIWTAPDGSLRLSMMSDDNKSLLQRNLYLEFILLE